MTEQSGFKSRLGQEVVLEPQPNTFSEEKIADMHDSIMGIKTSADERASLRKEEDQKRIDELRDGIMGKPGAPDTDLVDKSRTELLTADEYDRRYRNRNGKDFFELERNLGFNEATYYSLRRDLIELESQSVDGIRGKLRDEGYPEDEIENALRDRSEKIDKLRANVDSFRGYSTKNLKDRSEEYLFSEGKLSGDRTVSRTPEISGIPENFNGSEGHVGNESFANQFNDVSSRFDDVLGKLSMMWELNSGVLERKGEIQALVFKLIIDQISLYDKMSKNSDLSESDKNLISGKVIGLTLQLLLLLQIRFDK